MLILLPPFSNQDNDKATQSLSNNSSEIKKSKKQLASGILDQVLSSASKLLRKNQLKCLIDSAYSDWLPLRCANGGRKRHNDIQIVINNANRIALPGL